MVLPNAEIFFSEVCERGGKNRRPVNSVGRAPDYRAGGHGFKLQRDQHSGSLNN